MSLFKELEGDAAIVVMGGVYKQVPLYARNGFIFAAVSGGYVRLKADGKHGPIKFIGSGRAAFYKADFVYFDHKLGVEVIEDSKGFETQEFKLKRAILAAQGKEVVLT